MKKRIISITAVFVLMLFGIAFSEEPKVYGDADLKKYSNGNSSIPANAVNAPKKYYFPKSEAKKNEPTAAQQKNIDKWKDFDSKVRAK